MKAEAAQPGHQRVQADHVAVASLKLDFTAALIVMECSETACRMQNAKFSEKGTAKP